MAYKGKFKPVNIQKYVGDPTTIIYRSLWEYYVMRWLDKNIHVIGWHSEETVVPYIGLDGKTHRYFVDFTVWFDDKKTLMIEIKPQKQTQEPQKNEKRTSRRYIMEKLTYEKNKRKWIYAEQYAKRKGWTFKIWTEISLKNLGIMR